MGKQSPESQFKGRAWTALEEGKDFKARGEANKALFEELKKEFAAASSSSKDEKKEGREAPSEDTPGVQELYFHDGLGAGMLDAAGDCDGDAAPESAEPPAAQPGAEQRHAFNDGSASDAEMRDAESGSDDGAALEPAGPLATQPEAEQEHASASGVQDSRLNGGHGSEMLDLRRSGGDTGLQPAEPAEPQLLHATRAYDKAFPPQDVGKADDTQDEVRHLRQALADASTELKKLRSLPDGRLRQEMEEANEELQRSKCENSRLMLANEGLANHNKELKTQLAEARRRDTADPEVEVLRKQMAFLELEKGELQGVLAQQVARNHEQEATRSLSADARPGKSLKAAFCVGDLVYVASEYWGLAGKHPKGYDHMTSFVIVKQGFQPGCWDLCAKKHMRTQPKEEVGKRLPSGTCAAVRQQARLHSLYADGFLADVPALLLSLRPSPPAPRRYEWVPLIDLTKK